MGLDDAEWRRAPALMADLGEPVPERARGERRGHERRGLDGRTQPSYIALLATSLYL